MAVNGMAVAEVAAGGVLLYAGVKGIKLGTAFQSLLTGQVPQPDSSLAISSGVTADSMTSSASGSVPSGSVSAAQAYAQSKMAGYGWTSADFNDLVLLWDRESGWSNSVWNGMSHAATQPAGSSGAYGIPQSLPYNKMPKAAWPPGYGGSADAQAQIDWGLQYIHDTYGSPQMAWAHEQSNGWY